MNQVWINNLNALQGEWRMLAKKTEEAMYNYRRHKNECDHLNPDGTSAKEIDKYSCDGEACKICGVQFGGDF